MAKDTVILVVDDERDHADGIVEALEAQCAKAIAVYTGEDSIEMLASHDVDIVITDIKLGGNISGIDILSHVKQTNPETKVILITAYATIETCKNAMKIGAYDYLTKPIDINQLRTLVSQASKEKSISEKSKAQITSDEFIFNGVIGTTDAMRGVIEVAKRVSKANISVLIEGESGTGKEILALAIHDNSPRKDMPFRPINCAGLSETLLESELFGHIKGAFTGALADRPGMFEVADKGTLFLDEIGDMPISMQAKLLRVLEDGIVVPVGSHTPIKVDVRIISATNRDLQELIEQNKFRQDLYFRIKGVSIALPALRDRKEDVSLFIAYFLNEVESETGLKINGVTDAAKNILVNYHWQGNIRQLRNCLRTMAVMCDGDILDIKDIPPEIMKRPQLAAANQSDSNLAGLSLSEIERKAIKETLEKTGNNREQAAKILGIGERTLYRKIKEYGF